MGSSLPKLSSTSDTARPPRPSASVTIQEIQQVLQDEGYSAGQRTTWLKAVLTELSSDTAGQSAEREKLLSTVRELIAQSQKQGKPVADDLL